MGILYNRLMIILNEESLDSTYYHIAFVMLRYIQTLHEIPINRLAELCNVSKSTISKFVHFIGYENFSDFRYAAIFENNKYNADHNYVANVMEYIEQNSIDSYFMTLYQDIGMTYQNMDWAALDRLVKDIAHYKLVAAFGLMFSESAALDFQTKLAYNGKIIITNLNDQKQFQFIQNAGKDTLIIIFSDSGDYINQYRQSQIDEFSNKQVFSQTKAKVVLITSNKNMKHDSHIAYGIYYEKTRSMCTHRIIYGMLTDIIAYKYREYIALSQVRKSET